MISSSYYSEVAIEAAGMTSISDSDTSMVCTSFPSSDLKKYYLNGTRLFNLHSLNNAIKTNSEHSVTTYGAVDKLIGKVQRNGLATSLLLQM